MPRKLYDEATKTKARALIKKGKTYAEVRAALQAEGLRAPTNGWLSKLPRTVAAKPKAKPAGKAPTKQKAPAKPPPGDPGGAGTGDLDKQIAELQSAAEQARAAGAWTTYTTLIRALNNTMALRAKLDPPEPAGTPEGVYVSNTALRESAERMRAKLWDLVERARAERDSMPRCPHCGQPAGVADDGERSPAERWASELANVIGGTYGS